MQIGAPAAWGNGIWITAAVGFLLYLASVTHLPVVAQLHGVADLLVYEVNKESLAWYQSYNNYFISKKQFESMQDELKEVRRQLAHYKLLSKESSALRIENRKLKEAIHHKVEKNSHTLLAPPYFIQQDSKQSLLLPRSGVPCEQGDIVTEDVNIVGQITRTTDKTIHVQMITDRHSALPVTIKGTDIHGVVQGRGTGVMRLKFIKDNMEVRVGDKVQTKRIQGMSEQAYNVGEVVRVEKIPGEGFLLIDVVPSFRVHYDSWLTLGP